MTGRSEESRGVQRRAEWYWAAFWSTQQHSQQFLSPQQLSSLKQLHFLQTDWEGAPGCYSNLLYFGISSPLQVSLSVRLSVCLSWPLQHSPHSTTHSQTACLIYYIIFWYQAGNDNIVSKMKASSKSIFLHSEFPFKGFILTLNVPHHRHAG